MSEPAILATWPPPEPVDPIEPPPDATLRMLLVWWGYRRPRLVPVTFSAEPFGARLVRVNGPIVVYDSTRPG